MNQVIRVTLELPNTDMQPVVMRGIVECVVTNTGKIIIDDPGELTGSFISAMHELLNGGKRSKNES